MMRYQKRIFNELQVTLEKIDPQQLTTLCEELMKADRIFCDGLGRSGLQARAFCMRLMHLGLSSAVIGDVLAPPVSSNAMLVICSGSGESETLLGRARRAKKLGAKLTTVTAEKDSILAKMADITIELEAPLKEQRKRRRSIQPLGTLFEQASGLFFDMVVLELMDAMQVTNAEMALRHANVE